MCGIFKFLCFIKKYVCIMPGGVDYIESDAVLRFFFIRFLSRTFLVCVMNYRFFLTLAFTQSCDINLC